MESYKILVVDDDPNMRSMLSTALSRIEGYTILEAESGDKAINILKSENMDLVISDMKMPNMSGLDLLRNIREFNQSVPFIIVTAYGTIENAVNAMRLGATDYLEKGDISMLKALEVKVKKCIDIKNLYDENTALKEELNRKYKYVGKSLSMEEINKQVKTVSQSNSTVLITGESGTGKELIARSIHYNSKRRKSMFVKINCAAMPDTLIESELFGHEKGSFTGALKKTKGKFELADGGTLLMDEIGEMPMLSQAKLLRVLQEKEINKIGGELPVPVDVRIVATTNRDLKKQVTEGAFREDLFFRLNVFPIHIPPLRNRKDDIELLTQHFITKTNEENGFCIEGIEEDAFDLLMKYDWPGNIRELENCIERASVLTISGRLTKDKFSFVGNFGKQSSDNIDTGITIAEMEKRMICKTLEQCSQNKTKAAEILGISIRTLRNKLNEYEHN